MKRALVYSVLLAAFCAAPALAAPKPKSPPLQKGSLTTSFSYEDLDKIKSGTLSFDAMWNIGPHFALGPVVDVSYLKTDTEDTITVNTSGLPGFGAQPPAQFSTFTFEDDDKAVVISAGARAALYIQKSHNGFGFSVEGLVPEHDAEGWLLTPGVFFEAGIGSKGLFRTEYQHPFHMDNGEEIDLEGWRVSAGFGRRW